MQRVMDVYFLLLSLKKKKKLIILNARAIVSSIL